MEPTLEHGPECLHTDGTQLVSILIILSIHVNYWLVILNFFLTQTVSCKKRNDLLRYTQ